MAVLLQGEEMIRLDYKFMKIPLFMYCAVVVIFLCLLFFFPDLFSAVEINSGVFKSNIFCFLDFILPFISSVAVIMQLGGTFEPKTYDFICSLPIKSTLVIRWLRSATFFIIIQLICIILSYNVIDIEIGLGRMCYICLANTVLFLSLSLLITLLVRQIFYVFCILYGYLFIDLIVGDNVFQEKSVFVNIFANFSCTVINVNRLVVYCISVFCVIISILVTKLFYKNIQPS